MSSKRRVSVPELVQLTSDDLDYLRQHSRSDAGRTEVRLIAGLLRKLMHDGLLDKAWRALGRQHEPVIEAVDLDAVLAGMPPEHIDYAYAGGADVPGPRHSGWALFRFDDEAEARAATKHMRPGIRRGFPLSEFLVSPCVRAGGAGVSRVTVVRYVSNKLGAIHLDSGRAPWTDPQGSQFRLLDEEHLIVGGRPAVQYEVLSIAQALTAAQDLKDWQLEAAARFPVPDHPKDVVRVREGRLGEYADATLVPRTAKDPPPSV